MTAPWWDKYWGWFDRAMNGLYDPRIADPEWESDMDNALCMMEQVWAQKEGFGG